MPVAKHQILLFILLLFSGSLFAQGPPAAEKQLIARLHTDFIYSEDGQYFEPVYITSERDASVAILLSCYRLEAGDSTLLYRNQYGPHKIKKGVTTVRVPFQGPYARPYLQPAFSGVLRQTGLVPPGSYRIYVIVTSGPDTAFTRSFSYERDSLLDINSSLRKGVNRLLQPLSSTGLFSSRANAPGRALDNAAQAFERNRFRLERYFRKKNLVSRQYQSAGREVIDLYYEETFVGRYEMPSASAPEDVLKQQQESLDQHMGSFARNNLGDYQSLQSQFRELRKGSREHSELTGELALTANASNGQEPNSEQDNNYYEARGSLEFPLFDIPVSLSGYYTTQDRNRQAKSSYIHFRYDAEKAKEQLLKLIGSYNKRYEQTLAQGGSYDMIYGQMLQQLQSQKNQIQGQLRRQLSLPEADFSSFSEAQLKAAVAAKAAEQKDKLQDSLLGRVSGSDAGRELQSGMQKAQQAKADAEAAYAKVLEQYRKLQELEARIRKYQDLLEQYRNTSHYDSLLAYSKLKDIRNMDQASYKELAGKASGLLPEGKAKSLISGLINFDAGIFPKYVSDYTLSGQMLKGLDVGYDIGVAEIGGSYGKTQYIDRAGQVEDYKSYSGRVRFKPMLGQQLGLVYFGYSPGKKLLGDNDFFKDESVSLPSFRNPVHILSATYNGTLSKFLSLGGEIATSNKPAQSEEAAGQVSFSDKSAYNIRLSGNIPFLNLNVDAGYEHAGRAFENNTLPVIMAGTRRFRVKGRGDLFRSFLTLGIEYNYMLQQSFYSKGNNARWGFDIATHSKRYPSLAFSYKPFSTFRSYNDTLNIEQKPLLGEVWTGKATYQIKKLSRALRFSLIYNRNNSTMDTVQYGSTLIQFSTIYSRKTTMLSLNLGSTDIRTDYIPVAYPAFNQSRFISLSAGGMVMPQLMVSGGGDMAGTAMGISRYGCFAGSTYSFRALPVTIRAGFRYSSYRLEEAAGWKQLYSGSLELAWRFRAKLFNP